MNRNKSKRITNNKYIITFFKNFYNITEKEIKNLLKQKYN